MGVLTELYEESIEPDEFGALTLHYASKASVVEIVEMIFDRSAFQPWAGTGPACLPACLPGIAWGWLSLYLVQGPRLSQLGVGLGAPPSGPWTPSMTRTTALLLRAPRPLSSRSSRSSRS